MQRYNSITLIGEGGGGGGGEGCSYVPPKTMLLNIVFSVLSPSQSATLHEGFFLIQEHSFNSIVCACLTMIFDVEILDLQGFRLILK